MKRGQVFDACGGLSIWEDSSRKRISGLPIASVFSSSTSFELLYKGGLILLGLKAPTHHGPQTTCSSSGSGTKTPSILV